MLKEERLNIILKRISCNSRIYISTLSTELGVQPEKRPDDDNPGGSYSKTQLH